MGSQRKLNNLSANRLKKVSRQKRAHKNCRKTTLYLTSEVKILNCGAMVENPPFTPHGQ